MTDRDDAWQTTTLPINLFQCKTKSQIWNNGASILFPRRRGGWKQDILDSGKYLLFHTRDHISCHRFAYNGLTILSCCSFFTIRLDGFTDLPILPRKKHSWPLVFLFFFISQVLLYLVFILRAQVRETSFKAGFILLSVLGFTKFEKDRFVNLLKQSYNHVALQPLRRALFVKRL